MSNPAFTQARYEAISAAYVEGVRIVKYEDREVTYRSLPEMAQIMRQMEQALGIIPRKSKRTYAAHNKGLGPTTPEPWRTS